MPGALSRLRTIAARRAKRRPSAPAPAAADAGREDSLVEARATAARELLALNDKLAAEKDAAIAKLEALVKEKDAQLEALGAQLEVLKSTDEQRKAELVHLKNIVGATAKWTPPHRLRRSSVAGPDGIDEATAPDAEQPKPTLWRKRLLPVMLRLRAMHAFQSAGVMHHSRAHAVDEADFDRPLREDPTTGSSQLVLGRTASHTSFAEGGTLPELSPELGEAIDAAVETVRLEMRTTLAFEAARHTLATELRPADVQPSQLEQVVAAAISRKRNQMAAAKPPAFDDGGEVGEGGEPATVLHWRQRIARLLRELQSAKAIGEASRTGAPWASAVRSATKLVITHNEPALLGHMEGMRAELLEKATVTLGKGSKLRDVMKAHALSVHKTLHLAMDDVQRQFLGTLPHVVRDDLEKAQGATTSADAASKVPSDEQVHSLVVSAISYWREGFEARWALPKIEEDIVRALMPAKATDDDAPAGRRLSFADVVAGAVAVQDMSGSRVQALGFKATLSTDPLNWLVALGLGATELPLPDNVRGWLASHIATYLDPFIDGEVPPQEYQSASKGLITERLRDSWRKEQAGRRKDGSDADKAGDELPVESEYVLAQYVTHVITKMNTNCAFTVHVPGIGRQLRSAQECDEHHRMLGKALTAAIARDFPEGDRKLGSLGALNAGHVVQVSKMHLRGLELYQQNLGSALSLANQKGEENRREERMRIWGYS